MHMKYIYRARARSIAGGGGSCETKLFPPHLSVLSNTTHRTCRDLVYTTDMLYAHAAITHYVGVVSITWCAHAQPGNRTRVIYDKDWSTCECSTIQHSTLAC